MSGEEGAGGPEQPTGSDETVLDGLRDLDRLVHEPARLMLLAYLFVTDSADFVFLARQIGLTFGNLSSHVSKLEEAGYVEVEKSFRGKRPHTLLRLTRHGRAAFTAYRDRLARVLDGLPHEETKP